MREAADAATQRAENAEADLAALAATRAAYSEAAAAAEGGASPPGGASRLGGSVSPGVTPLSLASVGGGGGGQGGGALAEAKSARRVRFATEAKDRLEGELRRKTAAMERLRVQLESKSASEQVCTFGASQLLQASQLR